MKEIQFITPEVQDAPEFLKYLKTVCADTLFLRMYPDEIFYTVSDEEVFIRKMTTEKNNRIIVAKVAGRIVGSGTIEGSSLQKFLHRGELGVSVLKEYWGRGIGKELITQLLSWARGNRSLKKINLHVNVENEIAVKLYKKLGFMFEGKLRNDFYYENRFVDTYLMGIDV